MGYKTGLTPLEVANILNISKNTVYSMIKRGDLSSYKVGNKFRFDIEDIENYKNKNYDSRYLKERYSNINNGLELKTYRKDSFIICGKDVILSSLCKHLLQKCDGLLALNSHMTSYKALYELYYGNAQMAAIHLWDEETEQYNIPYVKKMMPGISTVIIHLAKRTQGMYVAKGNPKNIRGWEDLKRQDISIVNREMGNGTRILLDERLKKMNIDRTKIKGYFKETYSNRESIYTISNGKADIAIGIKRKKFYYEEIDFIPLQNESFDLVIKKEDMYKSKFQNLISILKSKEFKLELENIVDYNVDEIGEIIGET